MVNFFTSVQEKGNFPPGLDAGAVKNRETLAGKADEIYDAHPNLVVRLPADDHPVVVKWFGWRHPLHRLLSPTFPSRAYMSWSVGHALQELGALTPDPLYVYTRRERGIIHDNFLITKAIHPHTRLRSLIVSDAPEELMETAMANLARSIARMHGGGIFHRDLTSGNFLVDDNGQTYIVDLNRARRFKKLSTYQILTDLARINFKARDRGAEERLTRRFFQVYREESKMTRSLLGGYRDYRKSLIRQRRLGKTLRRGFRPQRHGDTEKR
ncbi:MAG: lipopolysaccharide kinase InaA family protein [Fidelibacterota bacterium]